MQKAKDAATRATMQATGAAKVANQLPNLVAVSEHRHLETEIIAGHPPDLTVLNESGGARKE